MAKQSIKIGKLAIQQKEKRGWLVGQFFEANDPFHDDNVEIYLKTLNSSDFSDKLHYHPKGKEYLLVLKGKLQMQIGEEVVSLESGDYVAIFSGTKDKIVSFEENTQIVGVRYPSIPDNKVLLE